MSGVPITIQALLAQPTVTAEVSNLIRIYPLRAGEDRPALAVQGVLQTDGAHLTGANQRPTERVSIYCLANGSMESDKLAEVVKAALQNIRGASFAGKTDVSFHFQGKYPNGNQHEDTVYIVDFRVQWRD